MTSQEKMRYIADLQDWKRDLESIEKEDKQSIKVISRKGFTDSEIISFKIDTDGDSIEERIFDGCRSAILRILNKEINEYKERLKNEL